MRFSSLVDRLAGKGSEVWRVHWRATELARARRDIVFLTVGDPDFDTPAAIVEATVAALRSGRTHYAPIVGYPEVRAAVARRHAKTMGQPTDADQVVLVPGAQGGLYCALRCLAGPGDEVVVPEPTYATYEAVIGATGATMVNVPLRPERGFHLDPDDVGRAITARTRVLWLNSPHNPTGAVMTRTEIEAVAAIARRHDLWLVSDEVYGAMTFDRPFVSPAMLPDMAERTVVISSLSKSHAMPGFRFGWIVAPKALAEHLFGLVLCLFYGGPAFIQDGAMVGLTAELPEVAAMRAAYQRRARLVVERLAGVPGLRAMPPEGGMFVMLDTRGTGLSAEAFALELLEREGVAVLPCDGFGPSAVGHQRVSLAADDQVLLKACAGLERVARRVASVPMR
jgi:arginine:pyruvate transaminase